MANQDAPSGLRYVGSLAGTTSMRVRPYIFAVTDATAAYVGDVVKLTGENEASTVDFQNYPVIAQAAATDEGLVGVVVGFEPNPSDLNSIYRKTLTNRVAYVCDDPWAIFEVQADGTYAAAYVGENADIVVAAGSAYTGVSGMELDVSDHKAATAQLRILGVVPRADNEIGDYTKLLVMINEHIYKRTAGV